jgi:hypothetical protein
VTHFDSGGAITPPATDDPVSCFYAEGKKVIYAPFVLSYLQNLLALKRQYRGDKSLISYLDGTWFILTDKFVSAWVNRSMHLGTVVTSRV